MTLGRIVAALLDVLLFACIVTMTATLVLLGHIYDLPLWLVYGGGSVLALLWLTSYALHVVKWWQQELSHGIHD